ncbi:MAG: hypothetical protein HeimC3_03720 [Candidatus Heimdallarchaeota archaeon LC_3]|nr:MAG: hypothetical protein HeimC3_03720 [Candidatus Heimdallarchaeota archaeon LC_3]
MDNLEKWRQINDNVRKAAQKSRRNPNDITIVGVTKKQPLDRIHDLISVGLKHIGENMIQEADSKLRYIPNHVKKHFIGPLQSNKVNKAVEIFDLIQTVDREKILKKIAIKADLFQKTPYPILFQVNFSQEGSKHGCSEKELHKLAELVMGNEYKEKIVWQGLMTIAPTNATTIDQKLSFYKNFYDLFREISSNFPNCTQLSMGMSHSYQEAIESGATIVRLGTILFGKRR